MAEELSMTYFKRIKIVIFSFFVFLLFILNSEAYQKYLDSFMYKYKFIIFDYSDAGEWNDFCEDIISISEKNEVEVFAVSGLFDDHQTYHINIYASTEMQKIIETQNFVSPGVYESFVSGKTQVEMLEQKNISTNHYIDRFYFYGTENDVLKVREEINNIYGVSSLKTEEQENDNWIVSLEWLVVAIFVMLLTLFDIAFQKKEVFIRMSLGESVKKMVWNNIIKDTVSYTFCFFVIYQCFRHYIYIEFHMKRICTLFIFLLLLNMVLYFGMFRYNMKMALSKGNYMESFCGNCYIIKVLTMIFAILSFSSNIMVIVDGVEFVRQNREIENYDEYSFLELNYTDFSFEIGEYYNECVAKLFLENYDELEVAYSVCDYEGIVDNKYLMINQRASDTIRALLNKFDVNEQYPLHLFLPKEYMNHSDIIDEMLDNVYTLGIDINNQYEIFYYDEDIEILYFDEDLKFWSGYAENPLISYCTFDKSYFMKNAMEELNIGHIMRNIMYKLDENDVQRISEKYEIEKYGMYFVRTTSTERYNQYKLKLIRTITINSIISFLLLIFELAIINTIIRLEYTMNAIELSVKKILGYSVSKKNKGIVFTILYTAILSVMTLFTITIMFGIAKPYVVILSGIGLTLIEFVVLIIYIYMIEKKNIVKILKGGAL